MDPEHLEQIRSEMEPPWHDLREQRVLRGVGASRARRATRRRVIASASAVIAFAAAIALVLRFTVFHSVVPVAVLAPQGSVLTLADGSKLTVEPRAEVTIESQSESLVRVAQTVGAVAYDVTHTPTRTFEVRAAGVTVRVLGTAFVVRIQDDHAVQVEVTRGRVAVDDGATRVEIGAGERLLRTAALAPSSASSVAVAIEMAAPTESIAPAASSAPRLEPSADVPTVQELLARADAARGSGRLGEASAALEQLIATYPRDPRASSARFTLARVARAQGQHAKAALAFRACESGPLAEDALAEEAASWVSAGRSSDARAAATRYLARFPKGAYAARMHQLVE